MALMRHRHPRGKGSSKFLSAYVLPLYTSPMYYVAARELLFDPPADARPRFYEMDWR
jgi:hypothetical protein